MIYKNITGREINTEIQTIICPHCDKEISKEDINYDNVYHNGIDNPESGENWDELWHIDCAEEESEYRREKYGY
jgi:hypothetical protein